MKPYIFRVIIGLLFTILFFDLSAQNMVRYKKVKELIEDSSNHSKILKHFNYTSKGRYVISFHDYLKPSKVFLDSSLIKKYVEAGQYNFDSIQTGYLNKEPLVFNFFATKKVYKRKRIIALMSIELYDIIIVTLQECSVTSKNVEYSPYSRSALLIVKFDHMDNVVNYYLKFYRPAY